MEHSQFIFSGSSGEVQIHGLMHPVCHDDFVGKSNPPGLHWVVFAKVLYLHVRIGVVGDCVSLGSVNPIIEYLTLNFLIDGKGGARPRLRMVMVLDDSCSPTSSHGCYICKTQAYVVIFRSKSRIFDIPSLLCKVLLCSTEETNNRKLFKDIHPPIYMEER